VVPGAAKEELARRQARAAATLLRLGRPERVWPLLRWSPDPRVRTYLIHYLFPLGTEPQALVRQLEAETADVSVRRALLLSLGEFPADRLSGAGGKQLVAHLLQMYAADPDGGIHSAVEWLLRKWGREDDLKAIQRDLVSREPLGKRRWYVNGEGHTLVSIPGRDVYAMGSPGAEPGRHAPNEALWRVQVPRPFAVATREVTAAQFARFLDENPGIRDSYPRSPPEGDLPATTVTWFEAMQYCRWLSTKEDVLKSEMCYPALEGISPNAPMPAPRLDRIGYRLPLEVEWEYAARAGAETSRAYGGADELLPAYAWYARNAEGSVQPTGRLKPNDFGLFDMCGNVGEWCQDQARTPDNGLRPPLDGARPAGKEDRPYQVWRGGAFLSLAPRVRSALAGLSDPTTRVPTMGFRIARTQR
jgi:formylglycine-generating enzyme required for sulfatase activity